MPNSTIKQDAFVDTRAAFRSDMNCHAYFQLNVTLDVTYKAEGWRDTDDVLSWLNGCLNCNPNHAEVKISNPTGFLLRVDSRENRRFARWLGWCRSGSASS